MDNIKQEIKEILEDLSRLDPRKIFQTVADSILSSLSFILGVSVILLMFLFLADLFYTSPYRVSGVIVEATYSPSETTISSGIAFKDDEAVPIITSSTKSEKWSIVLLDQAGKAESYEISASLFYSLDKGQGVVLLCKKGNIIGIVSCSNATIIEIYKGKEVIHND